MLPDSPAAVQPALTPETLQAIIVQTVAVMHGAHGRKCQGGLGNMPSAWVDQRADQVRKMGEAKAPHICYWIDPDGIQRSKTCGPGKEGERLAYRLKRKIEAELTLGTYGSCLEKTWDEFAAEYLTKTPDLGARTRTGVRRAFGHFKRLCKPGRVSRITTRTIDDYKAARLKEAGKAPGTTVGPGTVNTELAYLRAALNRAKKWGYTREVPVFDKLREYRREIVYVTPEHFAALYAACGHAKHPARYVGITPADYWRALLVLIYMTGMRINQVQSLKRVDVNLETGELYSAAEVAKGRRDVTVVLHPVVLEHLRRLRGFSRCFFPWQQRHHPLWEEFHAIQDAAGVRPVRKRYYGFHDLRRAFATMNADRMHPLELQRHMGHKDFGTTQGYIAGAKALRAAPPDVFVPELRTGTGG